MEESLKLGRYYEPGEEKIHMSISCFVLYLILNNKK